MDIKEFYEMTGGDYNEVLGRLVKEERIAKYLKLFSADPEYSELCENLDKKDYEKAFRNVHNLKGLAANIGLEKLRQASSVLCEEIRYGAPKNDISGMVENINIAYKDALFNIEKIS